MALLNTQVIDFWHNAFQQGLAVNVWYCIC